MKTISLPQVLIFLTLVNDSESSSNSQKQGSDMKQSMLGKEWIYLLNPYKMFF